MNKIIDLQEEFIRALQERNRRSSELIDEIAGILTIERDAAYRRLKGKVYFSVREMGIIAQQLHISLDRLLRRNEDRVWVPFTLRYPLKVHSIDTLCETISIYIDKIGHLVDDPAEAGNICHSFPMEFFLFSPLISKLMFFKWGNYFVGTEEFNDFSKWELPQRLSDLCDSLQSVYRFKKIYYIWDEVLIATLVNEIANLYRMGVITDGEKDEIKNALKGLLDKLEQIITGSSGSPLKSTADIAFYVSPVSLGFTSNYFLSEEDYFVLFQTNFSFSLIEDSFENFSRLKKWMDSFRSVSTLISQSGRIERSLFFRDQHRIIDRAL